MDDKWLRWRTRPKKRASAVEVTAQSTYDAMVKNVLSPGFRALGLKGSGGRYSPASDECWALMSLQKSAYSDATEVQLTVNLLVANKAAWNARRARAHLPKRPAATIQYGEPAINERIGMLAPEPADKWWRIRAGTDPHEVARDVLKDVRELALPWLVAKAAERAGA